MYTADIGPHLTFLGLIYIFRYPLVALFFLPILAVGVYFLYKKLIGPFDPSLKNQAIIIAVAAVVLILIIVSINN